MLFLYFALPFLFFLSRVGSIVASSFTPFHAPTAEAKRLSPAWLRDDCVSPEPMDTVTTRLNALLNSSGPSYILSLCPGETYYITAPLLFSAPGQEISTLGYPRWDERATITISGPVVNGTGQTVAIDGKCGTCDGVKLRNVQINGSRLPNMPAIKGGGANIEMGGSNAGQLVQYVRSYDPRSWSCLHISEGGDLSCAGAIVQYNDIGPCGSDTFQDWADGISLSCRDSVVLGNTINGATDGAIVLFGAPGSLVENNTIWVDSHTLLGGINLVDYAPFNGDYTGTVVQHNLIFGGFATLPAPESNVPPRGFNRHHAMIKIGIAIGPRTWFGAKYGSNTSKSGIVRDNILSGGFGFGISLSSTFNFTVENNSLDGNTSFFGSRGPNCSTKDILPLPAAFIFEQPSVLSSTIQMEFQSVQSASGLTCIVPPNGGNHWPFGSPEEPTHLYPTRLVPGKYQALYARYVMKRFFAFIVCITGGICCVALFSWAFRGWTARKWTLQLSQREKEECIWRFRSY